MGRKRFAVASTAVAAAVTVVVGGAAYAAGHARGGDDRVGAASAGTPATIGPSLSPVPTPSKALASRVVSFQSTKLPLEVYSLKRQGTFAVLTFGVKNTSKDQALSGGNLLFGSPFSRTGENDVSGVYLVDTKHRKKYEPAVFGMNCLCSGNLEDRAVDPGQTLYLSATYAAPPQDVTAMDVSFPKFGSFSKIPVS